MVDKQEDEQADEHADRQVETYQRGEALSLQLEEKQGGLTEKPVNPVTHRSKEEVANIRDKRQYYRQSNKSTDDSQINKFITIKLCAMVKTSLFQIKWVQK